MKLIEGGVCAARGFIAGGIHCGIRKNRTKRDLAMIKSEVRATAAAFSGRDDMEVGVFGNDERVLLISRFDNLGKGASGAAIQNMNLLLGADEAAGLNV